MSDSAAYVVSAISSTLPSELLSLAQTSVNLRQSFVRLAMSSILRFGPRKELLAGFITSLHISDRWISDDKFFGICKSSSLVMILFSWLRSLLMAKHAGTLF